MVLAWPTIRPAGLRDAPMLRTFPPTFWRKLPRVGRLRTEFALRAAKKLRPIDLRAEFRPGSGRHRPNPPLPGAAPFTPDP
jgi:hypothetical protein